MQVRVTPLDPFIARDSRPFGSGNKARTLGWPYPSVITGSLRSMLGKAAGGFNVQRIAELKETRVRGPLLCTDGEVYFPRPLDVIAREGKGKEASLRSVYRVRPVPEGNFAESGTDLPEGLGLVMPEGFPQEDFKPASIPAFWSLEKTVSWLCGEEPLTDWDWGKAFIRGLGQEDRVHVQIDPVTGAAKESMIFSTSGLDFVVGNPGDGFSRLGMLLDVTTENKEFLSILSALDGIHPAGGERRLSRWTAIEGGDLDPWVCPGKVRTALASSGGLVRMTLATPAEFGEGWKPGWLKRAEGGSKVFWEGAPPGLPDGINLRLRLVSAVVGRWVPVSGWLVEKEQKPGPKPLRRMVPAGSSYFFEVTDGDPAELGKLWVQSVCDKRQDRLDGFGLSLWGSWAWNHDYLTR